MTSLKSDVIEDLLYGSIEKKTSSGQFIIRRCPYCDKRSHLYMSASSGLWICYRCNEAGDLPKIYAQFEGITYAEALIEVKNAGLGDIDWKSDFVEEDDGEDVVVNLPDEFIPCHQDGHWRIPEYLKRRRVEKRTLKAWNIGYCQKGRYKNRIVIPILTAEETTFVARAAVSDLHPPYLGPEVQEGKGRRFLLGFQFVEKCDRIVICEGPFDALRIWQAGLKPLALLGKGLGVRQKRRLIDLSPSRVSIMLDPDAWVDARKIAIELQTFVRDVKIVRLEGSKDPGDLEEESIVQYVQDATTVSSADRIKMLRKLSDMTY